MNSKDFISGKLILIDKEKEWSSFDVVNKIRNSIKKKFSIKKIKVGHAGTLDPLATGLLILCTGKMTKNIDKLSILRKRYLGTITLGATTPSYDCETDINNTYPTSHITEKLIKSNINNLSKIQLVHRTSATWGNIPGLLLRIEKVVGTCKGD